MTAAPRVTPPPLPPTPFFLGRGGGEASAAVAARAAWRRVCGVWKCGRRAVQRSSQRDTVIYYARPDDGNFEQFS